MSELLILFTTMALLTVTPGPNNFLLATSGVQFGFRRSLPTLLGIVIGFPFLCLCVGLGLGPVFQAFPIIKTVLKFAGAAYLLYLAWRVAMTSTLASSSEAAEPIGFVRMAGFQWVNPKVWAVAFAAVSAHPSDEAPWFEALRLGSAFSGVNLMVCLFWTSTGALLTYLLSTPAAWRLFTRIMATALAAFSVTIFL